MSILNLHCAQRNIVPDVAEKRMNLCVELHCSDATNASLRNATFLFESTANTRITRKIQLESLLLTVEGKFYRWKAAVICGFQVLCLDQTRAREIPESLKSGTGHGYTWSTRMSRISPVCAAVVKCYVGSKGQRSYIHPLIRL